MTFRSSQLQKFLVLNNFYADEPELASQKGLYINERYQHLKAKECQALSSPEGRQIFAQRKIDVEPVFG